MVGGNSGHCEHRSTHNLWTEWDRVHFPVSTTRLILSTKAAPLCTLATAKHCVAADTSILFRGNAAPLQAAPRLLPHRPRGDARALSRVDAHVLTSDAFLATRSWQA